jgi:hypothetical protein
MKSLFRILILSVILFGACQQRPAECQKPKSLNPNGDSELALLMREMFEQSDSLKQLVRDGRPLSGLEKYQLIHSAIPTDPTVTGPVFEAFADAYIRSIEELENSDTNSLAQFNHMVDQCMNCHTEFCPGPKKRIKKLYIVDTENAH